MEYEYFPLGPKYPVQWAKVSGLERMAAEFWPSVRRCTHGNFCAACCWPWCGRYDAEGFGLFHRTRAHNTMVLLTQSLVPTIWTAVHTCTSRGCCNPSHLVLVDEKDPSDEAVSMRRYALQNLVPAQKPQQRETPQPDSDLRSERGQTKVIPPSTSDNK